MMQDEGCEQRNMWSNIHILIDDDKDTSKRIWQIII